MTKYYCYCCGQIDITNPCGRLCFTSKKNLINYLVVNGIYSRYPGIIFYTLYIKSSEIKFLEQQAPGLFAIEKFIPLNVKKFNAIDQAKFERYLILA